MARAKKAVAKTVAEVKPKEKRITLTSEQFEALKSASELISEARRELHDFDADNLAKAGFIAGQAFVALNKAEDVLDEVIDEIDPTDYDLEF